MSIPLAAVYLKKKKIVTCFSLVKNAFFGYTEADFPAKPPNKLPLFCIVLFFASTFFKYIYLGERERSHAHEQGKGRG